MISANSNTNPQAVSLVSPFVHGLVLATLNVCFPSVVPKSTSFVSPTWYGYVPDLTASAIVAHESSASVVGTTSSAFVVLSAALAVKVQVKVSLKSSTYAFNNFTSTFPFSFVFPTIGLFTLEVIS